MEQPIIGTASGDGDLTQILELQALNVESGLSSEEARGQGFVTLRHDLELLRDMAHVAPQVVARDGERIVGYALAMLPCLADRFPLLAPMFDTLGGCRVNGRPVLEQRYVVMGQVCIARAYRGHSVFAGLYGRLRQVFSGDHDMIVTELATRNERSSRAHQGVGFELLRRYRDPSGESWDLIVWNWLK